MAEVVKPVTVDDVFEMVLKLSPQDQRELVEKVVAVIAPSAHEGFVQREGETWGQAIVRFINELDMSDWEHLEIDDPVEWVKSIRKQEEDRLNPYWNGEK